MKRFLLLINLLFFINSTFSQERGTHDFVVSSGLGTTNDLFKVYHDTFANSLGNLSSDNSKIGPSINIGYKNAFDEKIWLTFDFSLQYVDQNVLQNDVVLGDTFYRFVTFGVGGDYHYVKEEHFKMYFGASAAWTLSKANFTGVPNMDYEYDRYFNFQATALGLRFGKDFGGFIELGFGYKGFLNVGLSYRMGK